MANSSLLRCPSCFNDDYSTISERGNGFLLCKCCGSLFLKPEDQSIDKITKMMELNTAESLLKYSLPNFEEAAELFKNLIVKYPDMSVLRWGFVRAKYEIKYEYDEKGGMTPIFYSGQFHDFREDKEYLKALELAETDAIRNDYIKLANRIVEEWENASKNLKDEDFDIFFSFKDILDSSDPSHIIRNEKDRANTFPLVNYLMTQGYKVFYSPISIPKGDHPDPFIYNAIMKSKLMIVYGSEADYFDSTWVKNEWMRYNNLINKNLKKKGSLVTVSDGVEAHHLPKTLRELQVIEKDSDLIAKIIELVKKYVDKSKEEESLSTLDVEVEFKKARKLEDEKRYEEAFEIYKTLDENFDHAEASQRLGRLYDFGQGVTQDQREAARLYKKAGDNGSARGYYNLAICYRDGEGVPQDIKQAIYYFELADEKGEVDATYSLAYIYEDGDKSIRDLAKAYQYLEKGAAKNDHKSLNSLGLMYRDGKHVKQDYQKAKEYFEKAIKYGNEIANANLAGLYLKGNGVKKDVKKALELYLKAIEEGYLESYWDIAHIYEVGDGVNRDYSQAIKYYQKGLEATDDANCAASLGNIYENGLGVNANQKKAVEYFELGAKGGNLYSKIRLGKAYSNGELGLDLDEHKAVEYLKPLADKGYLDAQRILGSIYSKESSDFFNPEGAIKYFKMASENGDEGSTSYLGIIYSNGLGGVKKDYRTALFYYKKIADKDGAAACSVANIYAKGLGEVTKDEEAALKYFKIASDLGNEEAEKKLAYYKKNKCFPKDDDKFANIDFGDDYAENEDNLKIIEDIEDDYYQLGVDAENSGDSEKAIEYYKKGMEKGDADCAYLLGGMYRFGSDDGSIKPDLKKAKSYYKKSLELGCEDAKDAIEDCDEAMASQARIKKYDEEIAAVDKEIEDLYGKIKESDDGFDDLFGDDFDDLFGGGNKKKSNNNYGGGNNFGGGFGGGYNDTRNPFDVAIEAFNRGDDVTALKYFKLSAEQGEPSAYFNLGLMYENGYGTMRDLNTAIYYYKLAAQFGYPEAYSKLAKYGIF